MKTEKLSSESESKKSCKISQHPANDEMFCKQECVQKQLCDCKEKKLQVLKQTQEELSKDKTKLLEQQEG